MKKELLSRDEFREAVFARDEYRCLVCGDQAQDAHHIMERRLFRELHELGGYFIDNGASVCGPHHLDCERTIIQPDDLRRSAGITRKILPSHLYADQQYDKWGNIVLPNGQRLRGELFYDESVQKVLREGEKLHLFTDHVKYPRTYHLPFSPGMHEDDRQHVSIEQWRGRRIVVTAKMDGENTTMYRDHIHARSVESSSHPSRDWVKNFWSQIAHDLPVGWRICGENLFARHSIGYDTLSSYFLGFSMWDNWNACLNWGETVEFFQLLGIKHVPVLYDGEFSTERLAEIERCLDFTHDEGYVLRTWGGFGYGDFHKFVGKFVRPNHVQTTQHWMRGQPVIPNQIL